MKKLFYNAEEMRIRSFWRIVLFFLIGTIFTIICNSLATQWMSPFYKSSLSGFFTSISFIYALYLIAKYVTKQEIDDFGYRMDNHWYVDLLFGSLIGVVMISLVFLIGLYLDVFRITGYSYSIYNEPFSLALFGQFFRFLNIGVLEETIFRSFLMITIAQGIRGRKMNWQNAIWTTTILTAVFFGIAHLGNPHSNLFGTINIVIAGLLLSLSYIYTGRIALAIGIHIMWNFGQSNLYGLATSGGATEVSLFETIVTGPNWITGSAFGPEAGLLGTIGFSSGIFLILFFIKKHYKSVQFRIVEN